MKKIFLVILLAFLAILPASAAVQTIQVTIGAGATQVSTVTLNCRWVVFQNNTTANSMHIGDSTVTSTKGINLPAGSSFFVPPMPGSTAVNLTSWYVQGTAADVIDISCDVIN